MIAITTDIPVALQALMEMKSVKDNAKFTPYKLAKDLGIDRSLLQRLLNGTVENPRVDTLLKIVGFFIDDGFQLNVDDLINWKSRIVEVSHGAMENEAREIAVYALSNFDNNIIGRQTLSVPISSSPATFAFKCDHDIEPIFKSGSLFIIDMMKPVKIGNLVAIRSKISTKLLLKKIISIQDDTFQLASLDQSEKILTLPANDFKASTIGVVITVNIKT